MITKGIIKSIDLLGNTCTVHIPFFETAGNDPIIETATVSNTPGSYNGYKVGDVVYVAFEDGSMSTPVVIGKLYLGTEKEKADPRGVSNVEESTASKKATLPADAALAADIDKTVPNTTVPYSSLSSIANGLNTLNTDVGQMDRDYGNRFKQVISAIDEQGAELSTEINQTNKKIDFTAKELKEDLEGQLEETKAEFQIKSDEISAEVLHKIDSETNGLGWNLSTDNWLIYAKDSVDVDVNSDGKVDENDVKEFPLFKITRSGVEVSGDLKLSGYTKDTIITYTQTSSNTEKPEGNGYTWTSEAPAWEDGKYIWQKTSVIKWEYNKDTLEWDSTIASEKIVCLSGASAVSYWLNCSTKTHLGQQQDTVDVVAMLKVGTDVEREDTNAILFYKYSSDPETAWTEVKTEIPDDESGSKIITHKFSLSTLRNESLEIIAKRNGKEYARETIVFSPVNTPILVFSKDFGKLEYNSYGTEKINEDELTTVTATVYLNNQEVPFVTWEWTCHHCAVKDEDSLTTNSVSVNTIDTDKDSGEVECKATYKDQLGVNQTLTKAFTVLKNKQGKATYKIDISNSPVSIPATEKGELSAETQTDLPTLTLHSLTCYYGDVILPIDAYYNTTDSATSILWDSISDNKFRIKYTPVNVAIQAAVNENPQNFAITQLYTNIGSILYELYRGTEKVATGKFEASKQLQGISATSYGVEYSAFVHRGTNQQEAIIATAWKKFGTDAKTQNNEAALRYSWRQSDGTFGNYSSPALGRIEVPTAAFLDADLKIEIGTLVGDTFTPTGESNIITYSPINTPVLDLSNDSAALTYDNAGNKIGNNTVSCTAVVYLDGKILSTGVAYNWSPANAGETTLLYDGDKLTGSQIVVSNLDTDVVEIICTATISDSSLFKETVTLTKTFTVSKQLQGNSIISQTTYYALIHPDYTAGSIAKPESDDDLRVKTKTNPPEILTIGEQTCGTLGPWSPTPPEHTDLTRQSCWKYWSTVRTQYSNSTKGEYSDPIIDEALSGVYELAQGKTTNYYSELEPTNNPALNGVDGYVYKPNLKAGDCWFKTISSTNTDEYNKDASGQSQGKLYQCSGFDADGNAIWEDIGGELVANKLTATYINALDITAKKVNVPGLFTADGSSTNPSEHEVKIAGFNVQQNTLTTGTESTGNLIKLNSDSTIQYKFEELESETLLEGYNSGNPPTVKPFKRAETLWMSTQAENKPHLTYYASNSNFAGNINGYGVTKITFTKGINNLKFFIKTTSTFTSSDRIVVSSLNAAKATPLPVGESTYSYASTYALAQGELVAVEYPRVEEGDHIYVTYKASSGQTNPSYGGYIYLPVDARITVGNHFKVLADGTVYANNLSLGGIVQEETDTSPLENAGIVDGNAGQFTAARVEVIDKTDPLNYRTLLKADGREKDEYGNNINSNDRVKVGGFTVTGNTLTAGHESAGNNITINSELYYKIEAITTSTFLELLDTSARNTYNNTSYNYLYSNNPIREFRANPSPVNKSGLKQLEYASTNAGVHASFSVAKITFTQALPTFDLYLYSGSVSGSTHEDYMWASVLNPSNNSCDFGLNRTNNTLNRGCKGLTRGNAGTIQKVTYENISKGNYIYVAYIKGTSTNNEPTSGNDVGYFYMPLNVKSSRLKIGENFEVMSDGTTYANNLYLTKNSTETVSDQFNTVSGQLNAISANLSHIVVETTTSPKQVLFEADGRDTTADTARVKIGGFNVSANKLSAEDSSAGTAVSLGTTEIMLGGTTSENAPFYVNHFGDLKAESGLIGGFLLTETGISSTNTKLQLKSNGDFIAEAGNIGGFKINPTGEKAGLYSNYLTLNEEQVYFPQQSFLNLNDKVKIYSAIPTDDTNGNVKGELTSYIATTNDATFIIRNNSGAGIKFAKDSTTNMNVTVTVNGPKNGVIYKEMHTIDSGWGSEFRYEAYLDYTCTISSLQPHPHTIKFKMQAFDIIHQENKEISVSCTIPAYTQTVSGEALLDAHATYTDAIEQYGYSLTVDNDAATCGIGWDSVTSRINQISKSLGSFSTTNRSVYSLGHFLPNANDCTLGSDQKVWASLHIKSAEQYSSDRNLKNSIQELSPDLDSLYDAIKPVSYKFNDGTSDRRHFGFIAQDLQQSLANLNIDTKDFAPLCIPQEEKAFMSVRYTEFIPLNTAQIQKLKKRVTEQDARIAELEKAIKELQTK